MSMTTAQAQEIVSSDAAAIARHWKSLSEVWTPFEEYAAAQEAAGRSLGSRELSSFVDRFQQALAGGMNVVTARTVGPAPQGDEGAAYELHAVKPDDFPAVEYSMTLSCVHLFASAGRLRLQTYDTPNVWRRHFATRSLERGGETPWQTTLNISKRLFRAAPYLAAAREVCRLGRNRSFAAPFGRGLLVGDFLPATGIDRKDLGTVLYDFGHKGVSLRSPMDPIHPGEMTFDLNDPLAIPLVRTFIGPDQLDRHQAELRNKLSVLEYRHSAAMASSLKALFRPVSVLDPVEAHVPPRELVEELYAIYAHPASMWDYGLRDPLEGDWAPEPAAETVDRAPVFRVA